MSNPIVPTAPTAPDTAGALSGRAVAALANWRGALIALVALAQAGVLAYMVVERESLLASGREITLDVRPVDPRSLFRGDYVILGYDISRLSRSLFDAAPRVGEQVYVRLVRDGAGWKAAGVSRKPTAVKGEGEVVLAGRVRYVPGTEPIPEAQVSLTYGIESFFVPEGTGKAIEEEIRPGKVQAHLSVAADGRVAIKALTVDGQRIQAEPLF
jgi:uncharacterized membrane-anchored protein